MSAAGMAQANAWIDYHQGYCFGKERGLLSRDAVLEAIRKVKGEEDRRGIGHRFFKGLHRRTDGCGSVAAGTRNTTAVG